MIVKTKKYALEPKIFRKLALRNVLTDLWWVFLIPIAMTVTGIMIGHNWMWITALVLTIIYVLFWWIQFAGVTQLPQYQQLFQKMSYEIDSQKIMMKLNPKQGMPIPWDKIKKAKSTKKAFIMILSRAQFIYLPHRVFNNINEIKFVESVMKRKNLIR